MVLFLLAGTVLVAVGSALFETKRLTQKLRSTSYLPKGISLLLLTAQASELVRVVESASLVHIVAALVLLTMVIATKSGTEDPIH